MWWSIKGRCRFDSVVQNQSSAARFRFFYMHCSLKNNVQSLIQKFVKYFKKVVACLKNIMYTNNCCGMIAMKREVAAKKLAGFPWSECQVRKLTTSHCTNVTVY